MFPLPSNPAALLAASLLAASLCPRNARADGDASPPERSLPFAAWVENGEFIGTEQLRRVYVSVGTNQLGFLVPAGLRVDVSRADRITLTQTDFSYFLTLRIVASSALPNPANDALRQQALAHYPGALLLDETTLEAAGRRGPMLSLRWKPAEGVDRVVTLAYLPTVAGVLEIALVAEQARFGEAQSALGGLLGRLQSCSGGRLRMETFRLPEYN
jgi:hypothetical protein